MEMLLEVASFDGSEKQCDILPAVSPTEVVELWPTFSIKHDSMELHNLVKCTSNLSGDVYLYPLTYQAGGRCSNVEKPVDRLLITQSVVKPSFQQDCGNMNPLTRHLAVVHLDCVCRLIMVCKELVQLPSVIDEKTVDQAFLDKLAFCLRFLKKLLGSLSKDVQSIENDGSLLQAVASFTYVFPKLFKVFVEKIKTKELFGGSRSSWINGLEAGGDDFVETVIRYILSDTMHVMTKRFHEMMVNMDKNAQLDAFRDALQNRSDITLEILVALSTEGNMESLSLALVEGVWHESLDSTPGELQSRRHLNVRGKSVTLPSITACSADISIKNLPSIISACDETMVACGDLGAELPIEEEMAQRVPRRRLRSRSCKTWCPLPSIPEEGPIHACFLRKRASPLLGFHFFCDQIFSLLDMLKSKATRLRNYLARTFTRSLSCHEITLSESYTCITFHSIPKTIHIFGNCILDYDPKEMGGLGNEKETENEANGL